MRLHGPSLSYMNRIIARVQANLRRAVDALPANHEALPVEAERYRLIRRNDRAGRIIGCDELLLANVHAANPVRADDLVRPPLHRNRSRILILLPADDNRAEHYLRLIIKLPSSEVVSVSALFVFHQTKTPAAQVVMERLCQADSLITAMRPGVKPPAYIVGEIPSQERMLAPLDFLGKHGAVIGPRREFSQRKGWRESETEYQYRNSLHATLMLGVTL